jgi:hypothetical protein
VQRRSITLVRLLIHLEDNIKLSDFILKSYIFMKKQKENNHIIVLIAIQILVMYNMNKENFIKLFSITIKH